MTTFWRILRLLAFLVLLVVALCAGALGVLTLTERGRESLAGLISTMASSEGAGVQVIGISGIWSGSLRVGSVVLSDEDGAWLAARGIAVDWSPSALLSLVLRAQAVHADRIEFARLPESETKGGGEAGLPVALDIARLDLPEIVLGPSLAGEIAQVSAEGSLQAEAEPIAIRADLKIERRDGREGTLDTKVDFAPAEDRLAVDIRGSEPANGIIANFLRLPGLPPVEIAVSGTGPANDWSLEGAFSVDGQVVTRVEGRRQLTDKGNRIEAKGEGTFERFVPEMFRPLLAGQSAFDFAGTLGEGNAVDIERAELQSSVLAASAKGTIDPSAAADLVLEITARDGPAKLSFGEGDGAVALDIRHVTLRAFGAGEAPAIDVSANVEKLVTSQAELAGIEAKLNSDGFDIQNFAGPFDLSATAERSASADKTIADLLVGSPRIDIAGSFSQDGIRIEKGTVATDTANATASGAVSFADGSLGLDIDLDLPSALVPQEARASLGDKIDLTATVSRDAAGTIAVQPLALKSGAVEATGRISYAAEALDVAIEGSLGDLARLSPDIAGLAAFEVTAKGAPAKPEISATVSSPQLAVVGRPVEAVSVTAKTAIGAASPAVDISLTGKAADQPLAGTAILRIADGQRRIDGLSLTLGDNRIAGDLALDEAFVPEGMLALSLSDVGPLASLANEQVTGEINGTVVLSKAAGVPQVVVNAKAPSLTRGEASITDTEITAVVADYLAVPKVSGQIRAGSARSGETTASNVAVELKRDGEWTNFSGGATVSGIQTKATGRFAISGDTTTVEVDSASASGNGIEGVLPATTRITIRDAGANRDVALNFAPTGAPASLTVGQGADAVRITLRQAAVTASGPADKPAVDISASIEKLVAPQAELTGIEAKLHSDAIDIAAQAGPLTLSATAESGGSVDETIAGLLAGSPKVDIAGELSQDGFQITTGTAATDTVNTAISGTISFADGSLALDATADLLSTLVPQAARASLGEKINLTTTVARDAAGTITMEPFALKSGPIDATGRISYTPEALDVAIAGNLGELSRLSSDVAGLAAFELQAKGAPATPDITATVSSSELTLAGRQIEALSVTAKTTIGAASPAVDISLTGRAASQPLTGTAILRIADGRRRIDGLSLTLGANGIAGDFMLDEAFAPEGTLTLSLTDIGPLASLADEQATGEINGTVTFSRVAAVPQVAVNAKASSLTRGEVSITDAEIAAVVVDYLVVPKVSGKIEAGSIRSGGTTATGLLIELTREADWTNFSGGATVSGIQAKADGRFTVAGGTTTVEIASASARGDGIEAVLPTVTRVTIKGDETTRDLTLNFAASGNPASLVMGEGADAVRVTLGEAALHLFGPAERPTIDASASVTKLVTPQAELTGVVAKLRSDALDMADLAGPLSLSATAESGGSVDETTAGLLAGALRADITARLSRDSVTIEKGTIASDSVQADLAGAVSLADGSLKLDAKANLLAGLLPEAARPALDRQVAVTATVARDAAGAIRIDPLDVVSGPFTASGTVSHAPDELAVRLKGGFADISRLAAEAAGAIGFDISASGSPAAPDIAATISSDRLTAAGREVTGLTFSASGKFDPANPAANVSIQGNVAGQPLAGEAILRTTAGERRIDGLTLTLGENRITGDLRLDAAFVPEGTLALSLPDIGPLAALAFEKAEGAVTGTVRFSKPGGIPEVAIDARAASIVRDDLSVKDAEVTATVTDYLAAPAISGKVTAVSVTSGSTIIRNIDLSLTRDGAWTGFSGGATIDDIETKAAGRLAIAAGTTTVELASGSATTRGITATLARPTTVVVRDGAATLDRLALAVSGGQVEVTGTAGQQLNLDIRLGALPASAVNAFAPDLGAAGTISGSARISGAAANPSISYTLDWQGAQTVQTRDAGFGAMTIASSGTFSGGVVKFTANLGDASGLGLGGGGSVDTGGRTLSVDFSGQVPFGFLTRRLAAQGLALSGTSNVSLTVRGSFGAPVIGGSIATSGARLVDARSGLAVNDIAADIGIASNAATIRRMTGTLSSGGTLSASGSVGIDAARGFPADLAVKIGDARYTDGRIVTTNLAGDVALRGPLASEPQLSGTINLARTVITIPERLPGSIATLDVQHRNAPAAVRRQSEAIRPASAESSGSGLTLDLTVNAPQQIYVRGRGLDAELGGSTRLTGALSSPRAVGSFTMRRGRLSLLARRLDFTRGTLGFSGSLIPTLDFAAESRASDATVTVTVSGLATNPRFSFTSSPSLPEDEVLARLIFGRSMSNLSPLQIAQLADAAAQLAGAGGSTSLLNTLRGKVGIDDLDIKTDDQGNTAVSAGKYLNDRTYVTIQKGDKAGSGKATIDFDVGRGVKLRGEAAEDGKAKGGIFFEREY